MKINPIPRPHFLAQNLPEENRINLLERAMNSVRMVVEELGKRAINSRNMADEFLQVRHIAEEVYGTAADLTDLRFGDDESAGTVLSRLACADHKHALVPIFIMERFDATQLLANTNNWVLDTGRTLFFVDADAARNVTGIAGGVDGWHITLVNDGSFAITFQHQNASSTAGNRFLFSTALDVVLAAGTSMTIFYDSTVARWRDLTLPSSAFSRVSGALTEGSVVFANSTGVLTQDNAHFFWDDTLNRLMVAHTSGRPDIILRRLGTSADADDVGGYSFQGQNSAGTNVEYALMKAFIEDRTAGTHDGGFSWYTQKDGTSRSRLSFRRTETNLNDENLDLDTRIAGDTDVNLIYVDASADTVQVGASTASDSAKFYVSGKISMSGECEINGDLNHDGSNAGLFGVAPVARATAYTQTYSTADRTHAAFTSADIGAFTGGVIGFLDAAERDNIRTQFNALRADVDDLKRLANSIIDDLQAYGWFQ